MAAVSPVEYLPDGVTVVVDYSSLCNKELNLNAGKVCVLEYSSPPYDGILFTETPPHPYYPWLYGLI